MYLFDTNVVSELRKRTRADPNVLAFAQGVDDSQMFLSVISLHELEVGAALMQHRDPMQGAALQHWLQHLVLPSFEGRILPLTEAIAIRSAHLHVPDPRSYRDAFIAATAYIHKLAIVTRNVRDFKSTGVNIINPWTPQQP